MAAKTTSRQIALFVAFASALHIVESFLPSPLPGVRLGLANILTLLALVHLGIRPALLIAVLRTLTSSLVLGTLFTPGFMIGFIAAVASSTMMAWAFRACAQGEHPAFSLVGISLLGALTHNAAQLGVVYALFIPHAGILWLIPWLGLSAILTGWLTGLIGIQISRRLDQAKRSGKRSAHPLLPAVAGPAVGKGESQRAVMIRISVFSIFIVLTLLPKPFAVQALMVLVVLGNLLFSKVPMKIILNKMKRMSVFLAMAFFIPMVFNHASGAGVSWQGLHISLASVALGGQWLLRIVILLLAATWLTQTISTPGLARGLQIIFSPLKKLGARTDQWGEILAWSVQWTPTLLSRLKKEFQAAKANSGGSGQGRWAGLSQTFADCYLSVLGHEHSLKQGDEA